MLAILFFMVLNSLLIPVETVNPKATSDCCFNISYNDFAYSAEYSLPRRLIASSSHANSQSIDDRKKAAQMIGLYQLRAKTKYLSTIQRVSLCL